MYSIPAAEELIRYQNDFRIRPCRTLRFQLSSPGILLAVLLTSGSLQAAPPDADVSDTAVLQRYLTASQTQKDAMHGLRSDVDIEAWLPKLKKEGRLHALRSISKVGQVTYRALGFSGDNTIKKDVIARYLTAEVQAQGTGQDLSITPANYKFKFRGLQNRDSQLVYVFSVSPRKKELGLFKGEVWLDPKTCMPLREQGRFVKNPSIFFKRMDFVRKYEVRDGVSWPQHIDSIVQTHIVGPVQLSINFDNYTRAPDDDGADAAAGGGDDQ